MFGRYSNDLRKCQMLTVERETYRRLVNERAQVNPIFSEVRLEEAAIDKLPAQGVPQQFFEGAARMP